MVRKKVEGAVPFVCMMVGLYVTMALAIWRLSARTRKATEMSSQGAALEAYGRRVRVEEAQKRE